MFTMSNEELEKCPTLNGNVITCPHCGENHELQEGEDCGTWKYDDSVGDWVKQPTVEHTGLFFYKCGEKVYLAGLKNRLVF